MHYTALAYNKLIGTFEWKLGVSSLSVSPPSEASFQSPESNDQISVPADEDRPVFPL